MPRAVLVAGLLAWYLAKQVGVDLFRQHSINRPSVAQSAADGPLRYIKPFCPFGYRQRFAAEGKAMVLSGICVLLGDCCPSAIFRRVRAIVIDTIKRAPCWTFAHISDEVGEGFAPSLADDNTARPIPLVRFIARGIASRNHLGVSIPQVMGRVSMRGIVLSCRIWTQAPATLGSTSCELCAFDLALIAAIAEAIPDRTATTINMGERDGEQTAKPLTGNVFNAWTKLRGIMRGHREPPVFSVAWAGTLARRRPTCLFTSPLYHKRRHYSCLLGATTA